MVVDRSRAKQEGQTALGGMRRRLAERAASMIKEHPEFAAGAAEVGLIDRAWLDDPANRPVRTATSLDVVQRFLERSIEQEPSLIAELGLNAIQLLSMDEDERRADGNTVLTTIVFTDLAGFTRFTSRRGDEAARQLLEVHHRTVGPIIRSRGGRTVKKLGDGLLLSFSAPEAAVLAAMEIDETNRTELAIRVGMHHGEAMVTDGDLIGHNVNLAARVCDSARGREILATTDVRAVVGDLPGIAFGRARRRNFKGVDGSVSVCPITRVP